MLERLELAQGVYGLRAHGKVTKQDYDSVVRPLLEDASRQGRRVRLLYHFGPEFESMTAGALAEDVRLGLEHLHRFERYAVVGDSSAVRRATRLAAWVMPCPVKLFEPQQWDEALRWIAAQPQALQLSHRKLTDRGVLVVEPQGRLRAEDFEELGRSVDPWIRQRGKLSGIVVHTHAFPGWENLGALLRHLRFLQDHHDKTHKLALATDTPIARIAPHVIGRFVDAQVKRFGFEQLEQAIAWASTTERPSPKRVPSNGAREQARP